jgi:hypothetical protein
MIYELCVYQASPGQWHRLLSRFADRTAGI